MLHKKQKKIQSLKIAKTAPKPPPTYEEKLFTDLGKDKSPPPIGPLLFHEKVFKPILDVCSYYLHQNQHSQESRTKIAFMAFHFRQQAFAKFGHDTIETMSLAKLLKPASNTQMGKLDSVSHIMKLPNKADRFDAEEQSAAEQIIRVWEALGRGLQIRGSDMHRSGGSGRVQHPIEIMDEGLFAHYREVYCPWADVAGRLAVVKANGASLDASALVFMVLVEDVYPEQLDVRYSLAQGHCLKMIKRVLKAYWNPLGLAAIGTPRRAILRATGGDSLAVARET